ncbi:MAG: hypothetical protein Q9170_001152 [Blastenia crenularia]
MFEADSCLATARRSRKSEVMAAAKSSWKPLATGPPKTRTTSYQTKPPASLEYISQRLNDHANRLFAEEADSAINTLDLEDGTVDFQRNQFTDTSSLINYLGISQSHNKRRNRCNFLFIHAAHSRDRLKISRKMFDLYFTHFRVMPEFVDFLLTFGYRRHAEDFYVSGFRQRTRLADLSTHDSGNREVNRQFELCYSLKSVEPSDTDVWSIRNCAVYHTFDLGKVRTHWVFVKGNHLIKRRIESMTEDTGSLGTSRFGSMDQAFETSLKTHLVLCEWSTELWRWYINSLEEKFRITTERAFSAPINVTKLEMRPNAHTQVAEKRSRFALFSRTKTGLVAKSPPPRTYTNPETGVSQPLPPIDDEDEDGDDGQKEPMESDDNGPDKEIRNFSFGKIRKSHWITAKANESILILRQNVLVLRQLKDYYVTITKRKAFPAKVIESCEDALDDFRLRLDGFENDMQTQILRLETLLNLVEDRNRLLHGVLDYQNTRANKDSTQSMVRMTEDMNDIARKTKIETVSMKAITLVTLCFLPGTFISTLMSTDVFQLDHSGRPGADPYQHLSPWQIYLAISLPLTVFTVLIWAAFHFWEKRREQQKTQRQRNTSIQA